jgi:uncharacterized protein (TIGR03435 family)
MRTALAAIQLVSAISWCFGQGTSSSPTFDVASVKPSQRAVGKDAGSQVSFGHAGISGKNVTLKQLIVEAYHLLPYQVAGGPGWLDINEYDVEAKADGPATREQLALMLRALLADRFRLSLHSETKELGVYELVVDKPGAKIHPIEDGEGPALMSGAGGFVFRGDMQQFANLLSVQLTIPAIDDPGKPSIASGPPVPVLDKTGLAGIYEIGVDIKPEPGGDTFTLWQRVLQDRLGLKLESRKEKVEVLVVDRAERAPGAN